MSKPKELCARCDELPAGFEGTDFCAACLDWQRREYFKELNGRYPDESLPEGISL